jgi:cbb3-type cytochrome oxidase subunit 3
MLRLTVVRELALGFGVLVLLMIFQAGINWALAQQAL